MKAVKVRFLRLPQILIKTKVMEKKVEMKMQILKDSMNNLVDDYESNYGSTIYVQDLVKENIGEGELYEMTIILKKID